MRYRTACVTVAAILAAVVSVPARQAPPRQAAPRATDDGLELTVAFGARSACALSETALGKLRDFAMTGEKVQPMPPEFSTLFGLRTSAQQIAAKQVYLARGDNKYFISFSLENPQDIAFTHKVPGKVLIYLTDPTRFLRIAAVNDQAGPRLVPAATADVELQKLLAMWAEVVAREPRLGGSPNATGC